MSDLGEALGPLLGLPAVSALAGSENPSLSVTALSRIGVALRARVGEEQIALHIGPPGNDGLVRHGRFTLLEQGLRKDDGAACGSEGRERGFSEASRAWLRSLGRRSSKAEHASWGEQVADLVEAAQEDAERALSIRPLHESLADWSPMADLGTPSGVPGAVGTKTPPDAKVRAEAALLAPMARAYEQFYGVPLPVVQVGSIDSESEPDASVVFANVAPQQSLFMPTPAPFAHDYMRRAYLHDLGFDAPDGLIRTVPLPSTYARRFRRIFGHAPTLRPRLLAATAVVLSPRRWLRHLVRQEFPINVRSMAAYRGSRLPRWVFRHVLRTMWNTHFHAFGHDMSMHVLATHRIHRASMTRLLHLAAQAEQRGRAKGAAAFFEETLTQCCLGLWRRGVAPDAFGDAFEGHMEEMSAALGVHAGGRLPPSPDEGKKVRP